MPDFKFMDISSETADQIKKEMKVDEGLGVVNDKKDKKKAKEGK